MSDGNVFSNFRVDLTDPNCLETLHAVASALISGHLDVEQDVGGAGEDAAFRGVVRSMIVAMADNFDGDTEAAVGTIRRALDEVAQEMMLEGNIEHR